MIDSKWQGKLALVTGASSGIGALTAQHLARKGLHVLLVARRRTRLEELASVICQEGGSAEVLPVDLSQPEQRRFLFEQAQARYGCPDVLVNNAGLGWYGYFNEMEWQTVRELLQVNVLAAVDLTRLFLPEMRARNSGHIINVSSIAGGMPNQGIALYSASKSFMDSMTTSIYRELVGTEVHISSLRPGPVTTEFFTAAARRPRGGRVPAERFAVSPQVVVNSLWSLLQRPRRVLYVPRYLGAAPWVEALFGWLIDLLGPLLLRKSPPRA
jgi:short-subunit dehydrogenase